jgi:hypothetical protein
LYFYSGFIRRRGGAGSVTVRIEANERQHLSELEALGRQSGLLLGLDGLMYEGGEPQLWIIRELQTGWTLRSGWMKSQDEQAFVAFLQPIAALNLPVKAIMSDKQCGLLPAVKIVFPQIHSMDFANFIICIMP